MPMKDKLETIRYGYGWSTVFLMCFNSNATVPACPAVSCTDKNYLTFDFPCVLIFSKAVASLR